jgi:hypothetical protein
MVLHAVVRSAKLFKEFTMNENAMMKKMGRGKSKMGMQEMFGKKKPAAKKPAAKKAAAKKPAMKMAKTKAYAKGGAVGGCEIKGNKKATMVKMADGGKTC